MAKGKTKRAPAQPKAKRKKSGAELDAGWVDESAGMHNASTAARQRITDAWTSGQLAGSQGATADSNPFDEIGARVAWAKGLRGEQIG